MITRQKQILAGGALLCLVIAVAGFMFLVKPAKAKIVDIQAQTAQEQSANAQLQTQIAQLQSQQAGLVSKQVELKKIGQRIPSDAQVPGLIRQLTTVGAAAGVDVVSITPGAAAASAPAATSGAAAAKPGAAVASYSTVPVTLSVQGNYSQLVVFLDKLETLQRLYLVKSISLTPLKEGASSSTTAYAPDGSPQMQGDLTANVTGEVYFTSADTTSISLPALSGAGTTSSGSAAATTSH